MKKYLFLILIAGSYCHTTYAGVSDDVDTMTREEEKEIANQFRMNGGLTFLEYIRRNGNRDKIEDLQKMVQEGKWKDFIEAFSSRGPSLSLDFFDDDITNLVIDIAENLEKVKTVKDMRKLHESISKIDPYRKGSIVKLKDFNPTFDPYDLYKDKSDDLEQ